MARRKGTRDPCVFSLDNLCPQSEKKTNQALPRAIRSEHVIRVWKSEPFVFAMVLLRLVQGNFGLTLEWKGFKCKCLDNLYRAIACALISGLGELGLRRGGPYYANGMFIWLANIQGIVVAKGAQTVIKWDSDIVALNHHCQEHGNITEEASKEWSGGIVMSVEVVGGLAVDIIRCGYRGVSIVWPILG